MPRARHARLLEDRDVQAWHKELALGSELTANNYLRMLGKFLEEQELTPKSFLKLPSERQATLLRAYIWDDKDNLGARPGSGVIKKAIISWLKFNNRLTDHVRNVSVKGAHITRGIQRLPSKDDLKRLLNIMDAKTRMAVSLIALGGQRPEVIGTYKGKDGLIPTSLNIKDSESDSSIVRSPEEIRGASKRGKRSGRDSCPPWSSVGFRLRKSCTRSERCLTSRCTRPSGSQEFGNASMIFASNRRPTKQRATSKSR